jgi:hypothetical protein
MAPFEFNQPYEFVGLEPQEIKNDFEEFVLGTVHDLEAAEKLIFCLANYIGTDTLGQFLDDKLMGRQ